MSLVSWILNGKKDTDAKLAQQAQRIETLSNEVGDLMRVVQSPNNLGPRVEALEKAIGDVSQLS